MRLFLNKTGLVLILTGFLSIMPSIASAEWEYVTHGGYDAAVNAWKRVALIFSDSGYKGLFISVIVLGALAIFVSTYIRIATGARAGALSWATPVLAGMAMYVAFIAPRDSLVIYDEALNRGPYRVSGIPIILTTSAGLLNKIERGFIDIISTSSDPASDYRINAGGTGWSLLDSVSVTSVVSPNEFSTFNRFVQDCVFPELLRDGTILDINKIASGEQQYDIIISESANPALYTVVYNTNASGDSVTCYDAAQRVTGIINRAQTNQNALKAICASKGYDVNNVASLNTCKNLIESSLQYTFPNLTSPTGGYGLFVAQKVMADAFQQVMVSKSPSVAISTLATYQTQSQLIGLGVHANSWIPVIKESLTAVAIGISPLILLFAATPLVGRAISLVLGMFVWLTMWAVIDAVIHSFGVDLAQQASQAIRVVSPDMGLASMYMFPGYSAKIAAVFGALRWSGLMLASVITGMLIRFGGTALAMLAGSIASTPQSSGAAYGSAVAKNAGGVLQSEILPTQTWANAAIVAGGVGNLMKGLQEVGAGDMAGRARAGAASGAAKIAQSVANSLSHSWGSGIGYGSMQTAFEIGKTQTQMAIGNVRGKKLLAEAFSFGDNMEGFQMWEASGSIIDKKMAQRLQALGFFGIEEGMKATGYGVDQYGNIKYLTAETQDGKRQVLYKDGMLTERKAFSGKIDGRDFTGVLTTIATSDGKSITYGEGEYNGRRGIFMIGTKGEMIAIDAHSGVNIKDYNQWNENKVLGGEDALSIAKELRKAGYANIAEGIEKEVAQGREVLFNIVRDPETGAIASISAGTGGEFRSSDFRTDKKGWENITKALTIVDTGTRIDNTSFEKSGFFREIHEGNTTIYKGTRYVTGDELPHVIIENEFGYFDKTYGGRMWNDPRFGRQLTVRSAENLGIFGKFEQLTRDQASIGYALKASASLSRLLKLAGVDVEGYLKGERSAIETIDANTLAIGLQRRYEQIMGQSGLTQAQKSKLFVNELHNLYKELESVGSQSTAQQLMHGVENPLKNNMGEKEGLQGLEKIMNKDVRWTGGKPQTPIFYKE